ncbi:Predicted arabinose efflux permease, MFS family [Pseudoxanthomonas sp. GM95]|uniref:MFS transporter n=1 Tax=Pseudoxanthomonas sp. GM95 TaxID=1881043 RepID=UPI0008BE3C56|nr:MFS transporter [Pseudoxanthomonas sp. GM95]SEK98131.1 Predicted arabinose efflux permease, MFS family [Pseudoxanthomonas sp. GM95]
MSSVPHSHQVAATVGAETALPRSLVLLLAIGAGMSVASLYYSQPMLGVLAGDLHTSSQLAGWVPTLNQLGYALGILLCAPLGDRYDRRTVILVKCALLTLALLAGALSPGLPALLGASLAIGVIATVAQDFVPAAATLAPVEQRGRIVGTVMTGLLLGILLSRVGAGLISGLWGWRAVYFVAALGMAAVGIASWRRLPRFQPTTTLHYGALLGSLAQLWKQHPALRRATLAQGVLAIGFSAFWSTLAIRLHDAPFHLGSTAAGAFGLAGAAGAIAAPLAGRIADRRGPELVTRLGAALAAVSFIAMALGASLPVNAQLVVLVLGTIGFDLGVQATLVSHQTIVYGIDPGARSRLNALLFTGMFLGMSAGAALGSLALSHLGWVGVLGLATVTSLAALAVRLLPRR